VPTRLALAAVSVAVVALAGVAAAFILPRRRPLASKPVGRSLYALHCASCHGANLEGQPDWQSPLPSGRLPAPPHDASGHTWHHSDTELLTITKSGMGGLVPGYASDMPAFKGVLTDDQISAVIAFIKSTWPSREREYQAERSRNGQ